MKKAKLIICGMGLFASLMSGKAFAGNQDFSFTFKGTYSIPSAIGGATKSDNETIAYITPQAKKLNGISSNMVALNAKINTRVRTSEANHATLLRPLNYGYGKYTVDYYPGEAKAGNYYLLYGNVESSSRYPVYLNGVWCP